RVTTGQPVGKLPRAIGRGIVYHHHVAAKPPDPGHDVLEVLALVVRREHDQHLRGGCLAGRDQHCGGRGFRKRVLTTSLNMSSELLSAATLVGAECRQTTPTSSIRSPRFLARYRASGS